jgi:hypothetical protein
MREFKIGFHERENGSVSINMEFGDGSTGTLFENKCAKVAQVLIVAALRMVPHGGMGVGNSKEEAETRAKIENEIRKAGQ